MRLLSDSSAPALVPSLEERVAPRSLVHARLSTTTVQKLVAAAIVPMVAVTLGLALTSDHLERPVAAGLYWGYLTAASMAIGPVLVASPTGEQVRAAAGGVRSPGLGRLLAVG